MLDSLDSAEDLIATGLVAPKFQFRSKRHGVIAEFDFGAIADRTQHPYRVQSEQFKLTRILLAKLVDRPGFGIEFGKRVDGVTQEASSPCMSAERTATNSAEPAG